MALDARRGNETKVRARRIFLLSRPPLYRSVLLKYSSRALSQPIKRGGDF
jgi:hypothetical protein